METTNINFVYQLVVVKNLTNSLFLCLFCNFNFYFYSQLQPLDLLLAISELQVALCLLRLVYCLHLTLHAGRLIPNTKRMILFQSEIHVQLGTLGDLIVISGQLSTHGVHQGWNIRTGSCFRVEVMCLDRVGTGSGPGQGRVSMQWIGKTTE